jgi:hypothetical protein
MIRASESGSDYPESESNLKLVVYTAAEEADGEVSVGPSASPTAPEKLHSPNCQESCGPSFTAVH